jgi:hypothetical protein
MSNWQTPITTWGQAGQTVPGVDDFNRIEGNIDILGKYDRAPGYGTATGTNTKAITLSPAPSSYYEGLCFAFKNSTQNTGAVTINVNGLGAKAIKKPNGNNLVSGNLKAGSVYTVRYNGTNFILQGSDSSGDAMPEHVLAGKIFSNDSDTDITGTMPNRGSQTTTLNITGASKPTKSISSGYVSTSTITAQVDPSKAGIIKKGEVLGGVTGTCVPLTTEKKWASGYEYKPSSSSLEVTGLNFTPSKIYIRYLDSDKNYRILFTAPSQSNTIWLISGETNPGYSVTFTDKVTFISGGFTVDFSSLSSDKKPDLDLDWIVFE